MTTELGECQSLLIGVFAGLFFLIALATLKDYLDRKTVT
jgi:capsular polysaccharide biosynthesis protein